MNKKAGPVAVVVAVVAMIVFLAILYRVFFPPTQRPDVDNPNGMPDYARNFLKGRKSGNQPSTTMPQPPGAGQQNPGGGAGMTH